MNMKCSLITSSKIYMQPVSCDQLVAYGIDECPMNTIRPARLKKDFNSVSSVFSELGVTPDPGTIVDCYRLGKYKARLSRPRPILVKFHGVIHVNQVLANKVSLKSPVFLKPDLSSDERAIGRQSY